MLVLSRRSSEKIIIKTPQYDIAVTIIRVHGQTVKVGVEAHSDVKVFREEVQDRDDKR